MVWVEAAPGLRSAPSRVAAPQIADADAGADERDAGEARADHFCCCKIHVGKLLWNGSVMIVKVQGFVQIDAGQDREHIGLQERHQKFERA